MADIKEMIQMKKRHFDVETDGFYGAYWKCKTGSDCAMIAMIGDGAAVPAGTGTNPSQAL